MKSKHSIGIALTLLILISLSSPIAASAPPNMVEVLVGFTHEGQASQAVVKAGGRVIQTYTLVPAMFAAVPENAVEALQRNPNIRYVEPNAEVFALSQTVPWGIDRVFGGEEYPFPTWDSSRGYGIKVAVVDTGIDTTHEDLTVVGGVRFYTTGLFLRQDNKYNDDNGHGTHVAGTIAALDNSLGVVGVAPEASLYAVKVLDASGSGSLSNVVAGIQWSVDNGMNIISMSLGSSSDSKTLKDACDAAYSKGLLLVASAGNSGTSDGGGDTVGYPAKYDSVIAVAATDSSDARPSWSSTGPAVELAAPGVSVYSTWKGNSYYTASGTSMACPHASGVAALVWAANPGLTNVELRGILQVTAVDLGAVGRDNLYGYGLVNAQAAVQAAGPVTPPDTGSISGKVTDTDGNPIAGATVKVEDTTLSTKTGEYGSYTLTSVPVGDYSVTASAAGYTSVTTSVTVVKDSTISQDFTLEAVTTTTLLVEVTTDKTSYSRNSFVYITVSVTDAGSPLAGASVTVTVTDPNGSGSTSSGTTNSNGVAQFRHRVGPKAPTGIYSIVASASLAGYTSGEGTMSFTVQ